MIRSHLLSLVFFLAFHGLAQASADTAPAPSMLMPSANFEASKPFGGMVYGETTAPVTVQIYASLTCPHCGSFHRYVFPKLHEKYVARHQINLVMHSFVSDQVSLTGTVIVRCFPPEKQRHFFDILLQKQDSWAFDSQYRDRLLQIAQLAGMDAAKFQQCLSNQTLIDRSVVSSMAATKNYAIQGIPVVLVNNKLYEGTVDYPSLSAAIDKALEEKTP